MARAKTDDAKLARLSPSQEALIYGPGRVRLFRDRDAWFIDDREMPRLVAEWLRYESTRRLGGLHHVVEETLRDLDLAGAPLAPSADGTTGD